MNKRSFMDDLVESDEEPMPSSKRRCPSPPVPETPPSPPTRPHNAQLRRGLTEMLPHLRYLSEQRGTDLKAIELLVDEGRRLMNLTPMITFSGPQSAGKSATVNSFYQLNKDLELASQDGITSKIPVEIRARRENTQLKVQYEDAHGKILWEGENFQEMYQKTVEHTDLIAGRLIVSVPTAGEDLTAVDTPGYTNFREKLSYYNGPYMKQTRREYMEPENAINVVVVRAIDDHDQDISRYMVADLPNLIFAVTHVDSPQATEGRIAPFLKLGKVALLDNSGTGKEHENIRRFFPSNLNILRGMNQFRAHVETQMNQRLMAFEPRLMAVIRRMRDRLTKHLEHIGFTEPDLREVSYQFRNHKRVQLEKAFNTDYTPYAIEKNKIYQHCSVEVLRKLKEVITPLEVLSERYRQGNQSFGHSNGWKDLALPEIEKLHREAYRPIEETAQQAFRRDVDLLDQEFATHYLPYTAEREEKIRKQVQELVSQEEKKFLKEMSDYLRDSQKNPYNEKDKEVDLGIPREILKTLVKLGAEQGMDGCDRVVEKALRNPEWLYQQAGLDPTKLSAQEAHSFLHRFWDRQCLQYHTHVISKLMEANRRLRDQVLRLIDETETGDLRPSSELTEQRERCNSLLKHCQALLDQ